jgi:hypothetical protein
VRTPTVIALVIVAAMGFWLLVRLRSAKQGAPKSAPEVYYGLRSQVFRASRSNLGIPAGSIPTEPWGVVMDLGVPRGSATVVALSDGNASIYLSSGGGYLGGGRSHESIRKAAQRVVSIAAEIQAQTRATATYPPPQSGQVIFYLLTDVGVFTASASEEELRSHEHLLSRLYAATQEIITEYRRTQ